MSHERGDYDIGLTIDNSGRSPVWRIGRLWDLAANLPIQELPLADFNSTLDRAPPFLESEATPTLREVAELLLRVNQADLSHPIILSAEGHVLDGHHRIAKAWMLGHTHLLAVRFPINPDPDKWLDRD